MKRVTRNHNKRYALEGSVISYWSVTLANSVYFVIKCHRSNRKMIRKTTNGFILSVLSMPKARKTIDTDCVLTNTLTQIKGIRGQFNIFYGKTIHHRNV